MMSYARIEGFKVFIRKPTIIHNEDFVIHTSFSYHFTFYESSYDV